MRQYVRHEIDINGVNTDRQFESFDLLFGSKKMVGWMDIQIQGLDWDEYVVYDNSLTENDVMRVLEGI